MAAIDEKARPKAAADSIRWTPEELTIVWQDGSTNRFDALWLRDNASGPGFRHPDNDQRLFDVADLPADTTIANARQEADGTVIVHFEPEALDASFAPSFLKRHAYDAKRDGESGIETWGADLAERLVRHDYRQVTRDPEALYGWLDSIRRDGFALMTDTPREEGTVCRVVSLFGYVRETNYGRLFDVRAEEKPVNMAYTGAGLGVHTDNPYRDPVPTLQLLHCLETDAGGGASIVVDGFKAAQILREEDAKAFDLLATWRVPFRYRSQSVDLQARAPMIETDECGRILAVRYNNRSIAPLDLPKDVMPDFYRAYRKFSEILKRDALEVTFRMEPGDLFVVDNRRVMHGRKSYGAGKRHLQGCYADIDSLLSTLRVMDRTRDQ